MESCAVDSDHFIRWFREKHRLCWKEIYLKLSSVMGIEGQTNAFSCANCFKKFQISEMATCSCKDDGSYSFHEIATEFNNNESSLSQESYECLKRQIQVIDDRLTSEEMKKLMLGNTETQYIEPQSMNFDKKLTEAYKEFKEYVQKKGPQQAAQDLKRGK